MKRKERLSICKNSPPWANVIARILFVLALCVGLSRNLDAQEKEPNTYVLLVFSNPVAGMEDVYNQWYDHQHAPDVVAVPGFVTAQRFVLSDPQLRISKPLPKYLVIYKIVSNDLPAVYAEVNRRLQTKMTVMDPSFDRSTSINFTYKVMRPMIYHGKGPTSGTSGHADAVNDAHPDLHVYYQLVFVDSVPGKEDEFNRYYDTQHAPEVVAAPGFVNAQRYTLSDTQLGTKPALAKYFILYKMSSNNLASDIAEFKRLSPSMAKSPAMGPSFGYTYKAIGPVIDGDKIRAERAQHK